MSAVDKISIPGLKPFKSGKVREVYDLGENLLLVASDRISAFDCVLPDGIPDKGAVLTQISSWWFEQTDSIITNHLISTDMKDFPPEAQKCPELAGRSMLVEKTEALPVECIVRGYLIGSGWKEYKKTSSVCGIHLPSGYQMADKLAEPIFTPSTKADEGHDENITFDHASDILGPDLAEMVKKASLQLYKYAADFALKRGIIIADTKFEFGIKNGKLILIDEALTPDSSRFWPADSYAPGSSPFSFDKQYVRDYLTELNWDKTPPAPPLPDEVVKQTRAKYLEAFELLTGHPLEI